eukprot:3833375-Rhodomonas_salina.4
MATISPRSQQPVSLLRSDRHAHLGACMPDDSALVFEQPQRLVQDVPLVMLMRRQLDRQFVSGHIRTRGCIGLVWAVLFAARSARAPDARAASF